MARTKQISDVADDTKAQITQLRQQLQQLMSNTVTPAVNDTARRAELAAHRATDFASDTAGYVSDKAGFMSDKVSGKPLLSVLIAAGVGFLVGRATA